MAENTEKEKTVNSEAASDTEEVKNKEVPVEDGSEVQEEVDEIQVKDEKVSEESGEPDEPAEEDEVEKLKAELQEAKDKYLRLYSEFENFRRRTAKEKLDMITTANEGLIVSLLPVMDDFERAQKALEESEDHKASKEGFDLIHNKFKNVLTQKGLKPMEDKKGTEFNTEFHEAISQMPVDKKKLKGKVIDVVEKGYFLDEKVIRFAKVVIGA
jgi:molecular chaperone GrpE